MVKKKNNFKTLVVISFLFIIILTAFFCVIKPKMHKPFSLNIVEYLIKINSDGSTTTTKQVTTTMIKEK